MEQNNISLNKETVKELFLEGIEGVMEELMEQVLNQLLEALAEDKCNAKPYEQTNERSDYRNGTRARGFTTRLGNIELTVPRLRSQSVKDGLFDIYQRSEQAIIAAIAEMVVKGVSTRDVNDVSKALFGEGVSIGGQKDGAVSFFLCPKAASYSFDDLFRDSCHSLYLANRKTLFSK